MSKKLIFLAFLFVVIGVALGWYCAWHPQQVSEALTLIQNPSELLPKAWSFVQQYWQLLTTGIVTALVPLFLAAYRFMQLKQQIEQTKQQTEQTIQVNEAQANETITTLATQKTAAENKLTETTNEYSTKFTEMSGNYVKLQDNYQDELTKNEQLAKQVMDQGSYIDDLKRKLEKLKVEAGRVA